MAASMSNSPELLREQVQALLIQPLETASVILRAGPRIFNLEAGNAGPIRVPKFDDLTLFTDDNIKTNASPLYERFYGENEQIGEEDANFDEVALLPTTLKSIKIIERISNELARRSVLNVTASIRDALVRKIANGWDTVALLGDGSDNTPEGLLNWDDTTQPSAAAWSDDTMWDVVGAALDVDASPTAWMMNPAKFIAARKWKAEDSGVPLLQPDPAEANRFVLAGYPVITSTKIPTNTVILGDFTQVAVGRDLDAQVAILTERYADWDQVGIRVVTRMDIAALNPAAIVVQSING